MVRRSSFGPTQLDHLDDVGDLSGIANGEGLVWNAATGLFVPGAVAASLDSLSDVDTSTTAPALGQVLTWDADLSKWLPNYGGEVILQASDSSLWKLTVAPGGGLTTTQYVEYADWAAVLNGFGAARYWDLSESSGNFQPVIGTDVFTVNDANLTRAVDGPFGGADRSMTITGGGNTTPAAELNTTTWTVALWIYGGGATGYRGIFGGGSIYRTWYLYSLQLYPYGFAWNSGVGLGLTNNAWYLLTLGSDGTEVTYYLNGAKQHDYAGSVLGVDAATANWGANNSGSEVFGRQMAHPAIWDRKLSDVEMADLWTQAQPFLP